MSTTYTRAVARAVVEVYTWTSAQARSIGERILDDLLLLVGRGFLTQSTALDWFNDIAYLLESGAVERIEIQLTTPAGNRYGVRYEIVRAGLYRDSVGGGLDLYPLPDGTRTNLLVSYRQDHPQLTAVRQEMARRGWTQGGAFVLGAQNQDRSYSKDGVGVNRFLIGGWP